MPETPLWGELQVTASVDDLAELDRLPVNPDKLTALVEAAAVLAVWARELRGDVEQWPFRSHVVRIDSADAVSVLAGDVLNAFDAMADALGVTFTPVDG